MGFEGNVRKEREIKPNNAYKTIQIMFKETSIHLNKQERIHTR